MPRRTLRGTMPPLRRASFVALVLVLLLAQSLGLVHRVLHAPSLEARHAAVPAHAHDHAATHADGQEPADAHGEELAHAHGEEACAHQANWLAALLASHEEGGGCRLFDQQSHGDLVLQLAVLGDAAPAAGVPVTRPALAAPAAPAAPFQARGPPPLL